MAELVKRVHETQELLYAALDAVIPAGATVALLDYPNHENVGDSAIWLGELRYLARRGASVVYRSDIPTFRASSLSEVHPDGPILLHGGGNVGDLWPQHQRFREAVLAQFPSRQIVQLPQTIHFGAQQDLEQARRSFAAHPNFTLLVRDDESLAFARTHFDCSIALCPDSAFALAPMGLPAAPAVDIVWLGRRDHEAVDQPELSDALTAGIEQVDWAGRETASRRDAYTRVILRRAAPRLLRGGFVRHRGQAALWKEWDRLAETRLRVGVAMLGRGRVVITDRLHGHIICTICGIPHVLLRDSHGKVSNFVRTWTSGLDGVRSAETPAEAIAEARNLLAADG
jgi:exopolysaccharide biosynthesis predicted pyruvyltransferase EpsI